MWRKFAHAFVRGAGCIPSRPDGFTRCLRTPCRTHSVSKTNLGDKNPKVSVRRGRIRDGRTLRWRGLSVSPHASPSCPALAEAEVALRAARAFYPP
eukprot:scaffold4283_cov220-Pinguiococcus_pyrenoidosus.AAC.1